MGGNGKRYWSLSVIHALIKCNSQAQVSDELGGKGRRNWSLPVVHVSIKHNSPPEVANGFGIEMVEALVSSMIHLPACNSHAEVDDRLGGNEKGIGHFQSYKHPHRPTYSLNSTTNWEKNVESFQVIHALV